MHGRALLWITAAATLPFLPLLRGEFIYDDIQVVQANAQLRSVKSFSDCFSFVLKPSKPISNFLLALGQWWGGGSVTSQRALSLLIHLGVVWLLYFNLVRLRSRLSDPLPRRFPFWVSLLFAALPIHSETLGIALFRMEALGTLFTLLAALAAQELFVPVRSSPKRIFWFSVLFFAMGLGPLSKEVYAVILPVTVFLTLWVPGDVTLSKKNLAALGLIQTFWIFLLGVLLLKDGTSAYPYREVVGPGILPVGEQIQLAAGALLEGPYKVLTGRGLTVVRLMDRWSAFPPLGLESALIFFSACGILFGLLWRWGGQMRLWVGCLAVSAGIYLVIPNVNIGSEHYWYFPSAFLLAILVFFWWRLTTLYSKRAVRLVSLSVILYVVTLGTALEARLVKMRSRVELYSAEVDHYPLLAPLWSDFALALMERRPSHAKEAGPFIERALALGPEHPNVLAADFLYAFYISDLARAERALKKLFPLYQSKPKYLGRFYFHLGLLRERAGKPGTAAIAYLKARESDPESQIYRAAYERLKVANLGETFGKPVVR